MNQSLVALISDQKIILNSANYLSPHLGYFRLVSVFLQMFKLRSALSQIPLRDSYRYSSIRNRFYVSAN